MANLTIFGLSQLTPPGVDMANDLSPIWDNSVAETKKMTLSDLKSLMSTAPSGVAGAVQFSDGSAFSSDATNFFWDNANDRLGLGTNTPLGTLHLKTAAAATRMVIDGAAAQNKIITYRTNGVQRFGLYTDNTAESGANVGSDFQIRAYNDAGALLNTPLFIKRNTGNIGINTTTVISAKLNIAGSGATSATFSQINKDSSGNDTLQIRDDGAVKFGGGSFGHPTLTRFQINNVATPVLRLDVNTLSVPDTIVSLNTAPLTISGQTSGIKLQPENGNTGFVNIGNAKVNTVNLASGTRKHVELNQGYTAISAAAANLTVNQVEINPAINMNLQTGTKIFRGIYHNPTLTGTIDNRAFESVTGGGYFNTSAVNASAVLQADSTTQGFLMPRMTTAQRNAIATPAIGLSIYNTTTKTTDIYDGAAWQQFGQQTLIKGSGATSATFSQIITNSSNVLQFSVRDDGTAFVGPNGALSGSVRFQVKDQADQVCLAVSQNDCVFGDSAVLRSMNGLLQPSGNIIFRNGNPNSATIDFGGSEVNTAAFSGDFNFIRFTRNWTAFAPSTNPAINILKSENVINLTNGTGTKIVRGFYHNPTVTGVTSHRAFESSSGGGHFNTTSVDASAVLQADSTTQGFLMPRMTTAQRDAIVSPATGLEIYNTTTNSNNFYNGTAWEDTKLVTTNRQAASYTLVLGDANKLVEMNVATANNLTVPLDSTVAYSVGTQILISQYGAGQTTVVATGGVTIRSNGGKLKLSGQYSGATLIKIATNEWYLFGDIAV